MQNLKACETTGNLGEKIWSCADAGDTTGLVSALVGATVQDINWKKVSIHRFGGGDMERGISLWYTVHCGNCFQLNHNILLRFEQQEEDTALIRASTNGHMEIVQLLLDANADINAKGKVSV